MFANKHQRSDLIPEGNIIGAADIGAKSVDEFIQSALADIASKVIW